MLRQADPLLGTVGKALVFPDRHLRLEVVDQAPCGRERLVAVRSTRSHNDGQVADLQGPGAVVGRQPHPWMSLCDCSHHILELAQRARMCGVLQRTDCQCRPVRSVVVAYGANENDDAPNARMRNGGHRSIH